MGSTTKTHITDSLKTASDKLSGWQADRSQDIQEVGKSAERSTMVLKDSGVSNAKRVTNTIKEVKQNTATGMIKEMKPSSAAHAVRELKQNSAIKPRLAGDAIREVQQSPAANVIKEVKPSAAVSAARELKQSSAAVKPTIIKDFAPSSTADLSSMLSDWNAQQKQ